MTIYRGPGGTGTATSDADTSEFQEFLTQSLAARDAAQVAETAAELAETNAETAAASASASASAASASASSASTSASSASISASAASSSASSASSSASAAASSASSAAASATEAAATLSSTVKLTGDQIIAGIKTLSSNPVLSAGTANGVAYLNGSKVLTTGTELTLNSSGILGLDQATTNPWGSNYKSIELKKIGSISSWAVMAPLLSVNLNCYNDNSNWIYSNTGAAFRQNFGTGSIQFLYAPTGTTGGVVTFSEAMRVNVDGNIGINNTAPLEKLDVDGDVFLRGVTFLTPTISTFAASAALTAAQLLGGHIRTTNTSNLLLPVASTVIALMPNINGAAFDFVVTAQAQATFSQHTDWESTIGSNIVSTTDKGGRFRVVLNTATAKLTLYRIG